MIAEHQPPRGIRKVAFIGSYVPRQCGIATFTADLVDAVAAADPELELLVLPVDDRPGGYAYDRRVRFQIEQEDIASYRRAAEFLAMSQVDLVCLQHEFGIYGGTVGSHVLELLRELRVPVVTTCHTVLREPDPQRRRVMRELVELSDQVVVMSRMGMDFLAEQYQAGSDRLQFVPHGVPDLPFVDPNFFKDRFGVEGRRVMLTFGLLHPFKGIEHAISALPAVTGRHPDLVYMILGATHPGVLREAGEDYRHSLQRLAVELDVAGHVVFHNRFVSPQELTEFIGASDLYITPYLVAEQITSGTLAYTVGAGKAVISTPYWYATEVLADGRGALVPFADAEAIAASVNDLLDDETRRHAMRKRAYLYGRSMTWPMVARDYLRCFDQARARHPALLTGKRRAGAHADAQSQPLPELRLHHLRHLSDGTGILHNAVYTIPDCSNGYHTADNARALVLAVMLERTEQPGQALELEDWATRCLAFCAFALGDGRSPVRAALAYDRRWSDADGDDVLEAVVLWALGTVLGRSGNSGLRGLAGILFDRQIQRAVEQREPLAWAYSLLAIHEYLRRFAGDRMVARARDELAERLYLGYKQHQGEGWEYFGDRLGPSPAVLPHALLMSGHWLRRAELREAGLNALAWLDELQRGDDDLFQPCGAGAVVTRGGERRCGEQTPAEAYAHLAACQEAYRITRERRWRDAARRAFEWFLGRNTLRMPLYDPATGGCRDALHADRCNENQGAEATLAFWLSCMEMRGGGMPNGQPPAFDKHGARPPHAVPTAGEGRRNG